MAPRNTLGEFERGVLQAVFVLGDDAYGTMVIDQVEILLGREPSVGAVYTTLTRLEEKGFLKSSRGEPTAERGGRAKKYFNLTPQGEATRKAALDHLRQIHRSLISELGAG